MPHHQRFEAWPPIHLKASALGGDLARHLNVGIRDLNASQYKNNVGHVLPVPLRWTLDDNGVRLDSASSETGTEGGLSIHYWLDKQYFNSSDATAPIFLGLGGEGGIDGENVRCPQFAQNHGALCMIAEHRFYGESLPASRSLAAFKEGLSVEQALADTSAVVDAVQAAYSTAGPRPVIAFGGSYSGALCAWLRQSYPGHAAGCVAQSAVINAIYDFPKMDTRTRAAIASPDGGECLASLQATFAALDAERSQSEWTALLDVERFNASNLATTQLGKLDFAFNTADAVLMLVQYGQKSSVCEHMQQLAPDASDDERIDHLKSLIVTHYGGDFMSACAHDSSCLKAKVADLGAGGTADADLESNLPWLWQTCSQLGYLQRAPEWDESDPFHAPLRSKDITLDALVGQCDYVFGTGTGAAGLVANADFNRRFGGTRPRSGSFRDSSHIFFMNWSDDPWQEASATPQTTSGNEGSHQLHYCMTTCDGCGHCGAGTSDTAQQHCVDRLELFLDTTLSSWHKESAEMAETKAKARAEARRAGLVAKAEALEAENPAAEESHAALEAKARDRARVEAETARAEAETKAKLRAEVKAVAEAELVTKPEELETEDAASEEPETELEPSAASSIAEVEASITEVEAAMRAATEAAKASTAAEAAAEAKAEAKVYAVARAKTKAEKEAKGRAAADAAKLAAAKKARADTLAAARAEAALRVKQMEADQAKTELAAKNAAKAARAAAKVAKVGALAAAASREAETEAALRAEFEGARASIEAKAFAPAREAERKVAERKAAEREALERKEAEQAAEAAVREAAQLKLAKRLAAERKVLELKVTERELAERAASEQEVAKRQRALQPWK